MKRIYIKEEACIGCHLCEVYCQLEHSLSKDLIKAFKRESPLALPRLRVEEKRPVSFAVQCRHCAEALCVDVCLTGALGREPDNSIVAVDEERCIGCWTCLLACPLGAIRQDTRREKALKCDFCQGEEIPACVANCPNEALVYVVVRDGSPKVEQQATKY